MITPEQEELIERKVQEFALLITLLERKRKVVSSKSMMDKAFEGAIDGLMEEIIGILK